MARKNVRRGGKGKGQAAKARVRRVKRAFRADELQHSRRDELVGRRLPDPMPAGRLEHVARWVVRRVELAA